MRDIKFRAWDRSNNLMVYPDFPNRHGGGSKSSDILGRFNIVMQYTGLKDKNGKEIYESDILKASRDRQDWAAWEIGAKDSDGKEFLLRPKQVIWNEDEGAWQVNNNSWNLAIYDNIEVIGNVWENPELLENP